MAQSADIIILSGEGPHADPWHPLSETSARLADVLGEESSVVIVTSVDDLAPKLEGADVLIVNASAHRSGPIAEDEAFGRLLDGFLASGGNLLAMHSATIAFPGLPSWRSALGATWDLDKTFHPPIGRCLIERTHVQHPITDGLGDFQVFDERYSNLDLVDEGEIVPLYAHTEDGATHPLVWARRVGNSRVVYDALGHGARSFEAPEHVELLKRTVSWLGDRS